MINVVTEFSQDVTADIFISEAFDASGRLTITYVTGVAKRLAVFPMTFKDLQFVGEGNYTMQDKKFYECGSPSISLKSILYHNDESYKVDSLQDRSFEGSFSIYIGKKIDDTGEQD
jgi:hypothetical protein